MPISLQIHWNTKIFKNHIVLLLEDGDYINKVNPSLSPFNSCVKGVLRWQEPDTNLKAMSGGKPYIGNFQI